MATCGEFGDLRPIMQTGFQNGTHHCGIQFACAQQQAGEQIQSGMPTEVANRGGVTLTDLDQADRAEPVESFAHGGPRNAQNLGQPAFAGQLIAGLQRAAEHLVDDLLDDILGDRASGHWLKGHA